MQKKYAQKGMLENLIFTKNNGKTLKLWGLFFVFFSQYAIFVFVFS